MGDGRVNNDLPKNRTSSLNFCLTWLGHIIRLICLLPNLFNDLYTVICATNDVTATAIDETVKKCNFHPFNSGVKMFKSSRL